MDKETEHRRTRFVLRRVPSALCDLGFSKAEGSSCVRIFDGHIGRVGLQKLSFAPLFRVIMSFEPDSGDPDDEVYEISDPHTFKGSPSGRKYNFGIRWGDNSAEQCVAEVCDFVEKVAVPWFAKQAKERIGEGTGGKED